MLHLAVTTAVTVASCGAALLPSLPACLVLILPLLLTASARPIHILLAHLSALAGAGLRQDAPHQPTARGGARRPYDEAELKRAVLGWEHECSRGETPGSGLG